MFEDSTFESNGRIHTHSRAWMIAAFLFNGSILLALILIPLIYPEALPRQVAAILMNASVPPPARQQPQHQPAHANPGASEIQGGHIFAPRVIPDRITMVDKPEAPPGIENGEPWSDTGVPGGTGPFVPGAAVHPNVRLEPTAPIRISSSVGEGLLLEKTVPLYPQIAIATRIEGTVVLAATISKAGAIENLRVVSGPAMLRQAALDAVRTWRYRPYQLDGQPVEVETTVNVIFRLER